jgi:hypothetical protein
MKITRRNDKLRRPLRPFIHRTFVQNPNVAVRKTLEANFFGIFRQMVWLALFDFQRIDDRNTVTRRPAYLPNLCGCPLSRATISRVASSSLDNPIASETRSTLD